jgi:hypothetical protein
VTNRKHNPNRKAASRPQLIARCTECGAEAWGWRDHPATLVHARRCTQGGEHT